MMIVCARVLLLPRKSAGFNFQYVAATSSYSRLWHDDGGVTAAAMEQQAIGRVLRPGQRRDVSTV